MAERDRQNREATLSAKSALIQDSDLTSRKSIASEELTTDRRVSASEVSLSQKAEYEKRNRSGQKEQSAVDSFVTSEDSVEPLRSRQKQTAGSGGDGGSSSGTPRVSRVDDDAPATAGNVVKTSSERNAQELDEALMSALKDPEKRTAGSGGDGGSSAGIPKGASRDDDTPATAGSVVKEAGELRREESQSIVSESNIQRPSPEERQSRITREVVQEQERRETKRKALEETQTRERKERALEEDVVRKTADEERELVQAAHRQHVLSESGNTSNGGSSGSNDTGDGSKSEEASQVAQLQQRLQKEAAELHRQLSRESDNEFVGEKRGSERRRETLQESTVVQTTAQQGEQTDAIARTKKLFQDFTRSRSEAGFEQTAIQDPDHKRIKDTHVPSSTVKGAAEGYAAGEIQTGAFSPKELLRELFVRINKEREVVEASHVDEALHAARDHEQTLGNQGEQEAEVTSLQKLHDALEREHEQRGVSIQRARKKTQQRKKKLRHADLQEFFMMQLAELLQDKAKRDRLELHVLELLLTHLDPVLLSVLRAKGLFEVDKELKPDAKAELNSKHSSGEGAKLTRAELLRRLRASSVSESGRGSDDLDDSQERQSRLNNEFQDSQMSDSDEDDTKIVLLDELQEEHEEDEVESVEDEAMDKARRITEEDLLT